MLGTITIRQDITREKFTLRMLAFLRLISFMNRNLKTGGRRCKGAWCIKLSQREECLKERLRVKDLRPKRITWREGSAEGDWELAKGHGRMEIGLLELLNEKTQAIFKHEKRFKPELFWLIDENNKL